MAIQHTANATPARKPYAGRAFLIGLAIGSMIAVTIAKITPALAQTTTIDQAALMNPKSGLEDLSIGKEDAPVTIIEYASMTCGHCGTFHNDVFPGLKEKYVETGKVRFIFREFPLDNLAAAASMLARCTADNDKAMTLTSVLFQKQREWVSRDPLPKLQEIAKQAGFTEAKFNACLQDNALLQKIAKQRDIASKEFGVNATPSFFINGKPLKGRTDQLATFEKAIDPLLKGNGS